jgi:uncharacterized LabA/DUF88 family protein
MGKEPNIKRTVSFIDGQNLFYAVKKAFGYEYPNYDPRVLVETVSTAQNWKLTDIFFYTGIPDIKDAPFWHHFWTAKLAVMGTRGIKTFSRKLRYRNQTVPLPDGSTTTVLVGQEKGIDVRIALDIVRLARENAYDVALIFSQDQDLTEAVDEVKTISIQQNRWIKVASAFPISPTYENTRGINKTEWIKIDRKTYDACLDPNDYRLKKR